MNIRYICLLLAVMPFANMANADIYQFTGEDDTISFTDTPKDTRYKLLLKEQPLQPAGVNKKNPQSSAEPRLTVNPGSLPVQGIITSSIGLRNDPFDGRLKHHSGLDISTPTGTPVKAVAAGTVIYSGWKPGYGNTVVIDHNNGMLTIYAHHSNNIAVEGDQVTPDTVIARSGSTGRSTGPHLHFEAWRNGENITATFIPEGVKPASSTVSVAKPINRYLQPDGTIVFTNLK